MAERANELFQSEEEIPNTYYFMWMEVGHEYFASLLGYDIYADIAGYDSDVLLLHGDADTIVPCPLPSVRSRPSLPHCSKSCRAPDTAFPARTKARQFV